MNFKQFDLDSRLLAGIKRAGFNTPTPIQTQAIPAQRQTMQFSATFPREVEKLASETLKQPKRIAFGISRPAHTVSHVLYPVPQHLKGGLLLALLKQTETDSVLIFTRTKHRADRLQR